jgi:hypothetical protein
MVYGQAGATEAGLLTVDLKTEVNAALMTELRGLEALAHNISVSPAASQLPELIVHSNPDDVILDAMSGVKDCECARSRYWRRECVVHTAQVDKEVFELRSPVSAKMGLDPPADRPAALRGTEACDCWGRKGHEGECRCKSVIVFDVGPRAATSHVP